METTVIMSIDSYTKMKEETSAYKESYQELVLENAEKDQLIRSLQEKIMSSYINEAMIGRHQLDELLKISESYPNTINGVFTFCANEYERYGITIDVQREIVTKYYNEKAGGLKNE